jgi:RNA polymerase sigma-70 factor (ECF subfamily)
MSTLWSLVCQAHQGPEEAMCAARQRLVERYSGAVRRYLLGALHDPDAADELLQEFALQFLRGGFRRADPGHGRFRSYLKTALFRLVAHYRRRQRRQPRQRREDAAGLGPGTSEQEFLRSWRDELLARAWRTLERAERPDGPPFYAVLRFRAEHDGLRSPEMALRLSAQLGRPLTPAGFRQILHRARKRFADALLDEVLHSLEWPTEEHLEQELTDLGLLEYCRPALRRRGRGGEAP